MHNFFQVGPSMFKTPASNMKDVDAILRFILAFTIGIFAIYTQYYLLFLLSFIIAYTATTHYCFLYALFHLNDHFSSKNYYLTFLPKYNPSAVFIFDMSAKVVFKNDAARKALPNVHETNCISIVNFKEMIEDSLSDNIMFNYKEKYYKIEIQGLAKEKLLLAYLTDVTEVIELNDAIEETQREVIYAMGEIGETRSKETGNHVKRVALYSKELSLLYGLSQKEAEKLQMASPMHDIGKVGIRDAILNAPRKLTSKEFEVMKTHAQLGYEMLKHSNKEILQAAAIVAHEHHEKWDGSGYPNATKGEEIHIYGRITAVADVFDALGSERVYKKAWELEKILELFKEQSGKHFDPKLVQLFLDNLDTFLKIRSQFEDVKA